MGNIIIELLFIFYQKREKLHDEEERKSAWVSQERQRTLDRLRTFKQVIKVQSLFCFSLLHTHYYYKISLYEKNLAFPLLFRK